MGFKEQQQIYEKLKEHAPSAFVQSLPFCHSRNVIISDGPTRTRFRLGPRFNYTFTGLEFFKMFMEPITDALKGNTQYFIECYDTDCSPPEKKREQLKRTESRKRGELKARSEGKPDTVIRYPSSTTFCEDGIRLESGDVSMFDIRGVTASSTLRYKLLVFVAELLVFHPLPLGTSVILDFTAAGPMQFIRHAGTLQNVCFTLNNMRHLFAESEPQIAMWTRVFSTQWDEKSPLPMIVCRSTDSDMLAILGSLVEHTRPKNDIFFERGKIQGKPKRGAPTVHPLVNMNTLVSHLNQAGIEMWMLILMCNAMGSDWCLKENLTKGSGFARAWPTFVEHIKQKGFDGFEFDTGHLVAEGKVTVWERLLCNPDIRKEDLVYFADRKSLPEAKDDSGFEFDVTKWLKASDIIATFCAKLPGHQEATPDARTRGCVDLCFAMQYQMFPWTLINVRPPSVFFEQEDLDADKAMSVVLS